MIDDHPSKELLHTKNCVVVTVAEVKGSAPREEGATLTVFDSHEIGTIGGGSMELEAINNARQILAEGAAKAFTKLSRKRLEASYDQCCGGAVVLMIEYFPVGDGSKLDSIIDSFVAKHGASVLLSRTGFDDRCDQYRALIAHEEVIYDDINDQGFSAEEIRIAREMLAGLKTGSSLCKLRESDEGGHALFQIFVPQKFNITLFGAGHVGRALVQVLTNLDCSIRWVDSRPDIFPDYIPENTRAIYNEFPAIEVTSAPPNSLFLVMTHSHSLDYEICDHILARDDVLFLGLIGSKSKALRFARNFRERGLSAEQINKITCPIGIAGIRNKSAKAIAVSTAAQLLQIQESQ